MVVQHARADGEATRAARALATAGSARTRTRTRPAERRAEPPVFTAVRREQYTHYSAALLNNSVLQRARTCFVWCIITRARR